MEYINLAENTGIDTIINKKISAASRIFRHTTNPNVTQVKYMTGTDAEVIEFNVPANSKITKGTLRSLDFQKIDCRRMEREDEFHSRNTTTLF